MKIWWLICSLFLLYCISILLDERYDVIYHLEYDSNWRKSIKYSGCFNLNKIINKKINLNQLNDTFYQFMNELKYECPIPYPKTKFKINQDKILDQIRRKNYYILNDQICIELPSLIYLENFEQCKNDKNLMPVYFVFNDKAKNQFLRLESIDSIFEELIVIHLESPYSNCTFKTSLNKFVCLNNCIINKLKQVGLKITKYYLDGNQDETIKLDLNYQLENNNLTIKDNEIIRSNELECIKKCRKQTHDCELITLYFNYDKNKQSIVNIIRAHPLITSINYYIQLIGLICFFTGICFCQLIIKLINLIIRKLPTIKIKNYIINLERCLIWFKFIILFILLINLSILFYEMISDHLKKTDYPIKKQVLTTKLKLDSTFNLVICLDFKNIFNQSFNYKNRTLFELENLTSFDLFYDYIDDIYLDYQNKLIKIDWYINKDKIVFYNSQRCYQLIIYPKEYKYQSSLLISKLIVKFKHNYTRYNHQFFILSKNELFNTNSFIGNINYNYIKLLIRRSNSKCFNYVNELCNCKFSCYDRCMIREYLDNNQNLSSKLLINKNQFTNDQWIKLSINYYSDDYLYDQIRMKCNQIYLNRSDCNEKSYIYKTKFEYMGGNKLIFDLFIDKINEIEEKTSLYKLLLDLLNVQSILFGLNIFKLISILFDYNRIKFKFNKLIIYLLCLIGFTYHLWFIINGLLSEELIYSQYYKLVDQLKITNHIFCFKYNENLIDLNNELNFNYLDKITNQLNIDKLFNEIMYLNKSNQWIKLKSNSSFQDNNLIIDTFYFIDKKCFEIKLNTYFHKDQFEFSDKDGKKEVLKINFNRSFINDYGNCYFLTKIPDSHIRFSKMYQLLLANITYSTFNELFEIDYDDKFYSIKNPLSLFYNQNNLNDADLYLNNLINNFNQNYNLITLNLPLYKTNLSIDDQLFDQFYLQIQNVSDHNQPSNPNYKIEFTNNNLESSFETDIEYSSFNLIYHKRIIKITNEDNYTKLILNFLNLLSLWYDIGVFDLEIYLDLIIIKIKFAFIYIYRSLIKFYNYRSSYIRL